VDGRAECLARDRPEEQAKEAESGKPTHHAEEYDDYRQTTMTDRYTIQREAEHKLAHGGRCQVPPVALKAVRWAARV
jgi:hypothetical protein